ncbi:MULTISPECIES: hypothetical protein [Limnobacter]|uniref:DUF1145 domain-containing protein n=2 Tax=Limnobacter TaxID=131079 RepID=A0ABQ5YUZ6_9BURK|nr:MULTISPECIES: hypothetical protein [Limnobacter]GLR27291.1 hypothetical protein GCM10007875_23820 [Limnobacter litoralis]HEX5486753.1 hypothetical protein [Limnobacter sp.]
MGSGKIWYVLQGGLVVFWLAIPLIGLLGHHIMWLNMLGAIILAAHILELPVAFNRLRDKQVPVSKVCLNTVIFGFTWWLPVSKGDIPA